MSWNMPGNIMGLFGMAGQEAGKEDNSQQDQGQDVFAKVREALYGGSQMGNAMGPMSGNGMMGMLMGGMGYKSGGAVDAANEAVRAHLRRGGPPMQVGNYNFHPQFANDRDALIRAVYAEAGNQGPQGQSMVAHNIMNRADANYGGYGNGIQDQILAQNAKGTGGQYSSFLANRPSTNVASINAMKLDPNGAEYAKVGNVVDNAMGRLEPDPTHGASHYYAPQGMPGGVAPRWAHDPGMNFIGQEGAHRFYQSAGFNPQQPATPMQMGDQQALSNMQNGDKLAMSIANRPDTFGINKTMSLPQDIANAQPPAPPPPLPPTRPTDFGGGNDLPSRGMPMGNDLPSRADVPLPPTRPEMGPPMAGMSHPNMGPMTQEMAHPFMGPQMMDMTKPADAPQIDNFKGPSGDVNVLNDAPKAADVDISQGAPDAPDMPDSAPDMTAGLEHAWGSADDLGGAGDLLGVFDIFNRGGTVRPFGDRPGKGGGGAAADAVARILRAYHGSPHKFDRFDLSKIGTGQGAQSFGHGLYFAGNEKVAKDYRDTLSDGTLIDSSGRVIRPMDDLLHTNVAITTDRKGIDAGLARAQALINSQTPDGAAPSLDQLMSMSFNKPHRSWDALMSDYEKLQNWKAQGVTQNPGHMYEVDLNTDPNKMLDWYAPMSQQPENVRGALMDRAAKAADAANEARAFMLNRGTNSFGKPFTPERMEQLRTVADPENFTGNAMYNLTMQDHGAISPGEKMPEASQALFDMGIPGIKYRDQGSFGLPPEQQTSNYVMFDDKPIEILRRYARGGRAGFATDGGVDGDVQFAPDEMHPDDTLMRRPSIPVHMYSDKMADAISHDQPVWEAPKDTSGAQAPDDRAHEVVDRMLHPQSSVPMMLSQDMWDKAKQYNADNTIVPSQDAHSFVQQALNKGEKQLPQYDPTTEQNIAEGAKTAGHIGMYAVPYLGEAMAGYDAAQAAKYLASGDAKKAWDEGNYGELGGYVADAAGMTMGLKGKALQRALQLGGVGGVGSIMAPEDAEAGVFSHMGDDAYKAALEAVQRLSGKSSDLLVTHSGDARQLADTLLRTDGALTAPSLALSKMGGVPLDFGGVTLVGRPHLAVPGGDNMVFSGDAFTPRVPFPRMEPTGEPGVYRSWMPRTRELERATVVPPEGRVDPTPENIINYIKSGPILGGEGEGVHDAHTLMVQANGPFKSFEDVKKFGKDLPWDEHENKDAWSDYYSELDGMGGLLQKYHQRQPGASTYNDRNYRHNFSAAVADYLQNGQDWQTFLKHYPDAPPITQPRIRDFISTLQNMRPSYMEAKPLRQVGMDEFAGAVIPTGQSQERLMELLQHYGMDKKNIHLYQRDNDQQRLHRLLSFQDQLFSEGGEVGDRVAKGGGGPMSKIAQELASRLGKLHPEGSGFAGIPNQPSVVNLPGIGRVEARPIEDLQAAKDRILNAQGRPAGDPQLVPINPQFSARVAKAFDAMAHDPNDPLVKRSYDALISDTMDQYKEAKKAGYDFHFMRDGEADPYAASPALGYADLVNNRRMTVFPTEQGFGSETAIRDNPLLTRVGRVGDLDNATANDAFRIVHDVYGHHGPGNPFFRGPGEERAYQYHSNMFSDQALPAAASETRGQNSWVNYGPHAEHNAKASGADTIYADQKTGVLPYWATALPPNEGMSDSDIDDYVRTLMRRASGGRTNAAEDTTAHDFDRQMLDSGEPQIPQHNDRFERGMNELFGVPQAEAGAGKEAAEYVARQLAKYGKQTVNDPQRNLFPGIYSNPADIAEEAASRVAPESTALKQLFGVTRQDLYDIGNGRIGNAEPELATKAGARGSEATANVMTRRNASRIQDILAEAGNHDGLRIGMDAWYVMDPLYQQLERLYGKEEAVKQFNMLNHATGTMSPGSPVTTEMNRGLAAYYLANNGRYDDFVQYGGNPAKATKPQTGRNISFAQEFPQLLGHPYHSTSQAPILGKYLETGEHGMQSPKVPLYIQSSGVPETGHQTALPVADAHFTRGLGLSDTRKANKGAGDSMKMSEFQQLGPWFADKVAKKVGLQAVPAQARLWGALSKHTGVDTAIGAPKLELMANEIMRISRQYGISPERARDMVLQGELFNQGGAVNDNVTAASDRARSLASAT